MTKVQELRERLGWSKSELARRAEVTPSTISTLEAGRWIPYAVQVEKIARALGVKPEELGIVQPDQLQSAS